jgi:hypothetical protein
MELKHFPTGIKPFVVIESPFKGDLVRNVLYADCLQFDSLMRGEAPFLGHLLYTRVFADANPQQREMGITAHIAALTRASYVVVGLDLGPPSAGMWEAINVANLRQIEIVERRLGEGWETRYPIARTEGFV